jgi:Sulfotransferase family
MPTLDSRPSGSVATPGPRNGHADTDSPFYVPPILDFLGWWVQHCRPFWLSLGRLETNLLADRLRTVRVTQPVFISGLARSGSTLLHEIVACHPHVGTHRIKDYPMVYTPYWWRQATAGMRQAPPRERPHQDKVMVTMNSPDALEEMVWLAFFHRCHDPTVSNRLGAEDHHPAFEVFYRSHIQKLLLAEQASRYAAKDNYHVARLLYLVRLFPDARFLLPVRDPVTHIASLMRQHQWFSQGHRKYPRSLTYMQRSGHFEFGRDRRPINLGDSEQVQGIRRAWAAGEEVRGWARYWKMIYGYLAQLLNSNAQVGAAARIVRFESLCDNPTETIRAALEHCSLPDGEQCLARYGAEIRRPNYYKTSFSPEDLAIIHEETSGTASHWGYGSG